MRWAVVAVGALVLTSAATASRPATYTEQRWMSSNSNTAIGQGVVWARVSTRDPHYGIYYVKRCAAAADPCGAHTHPTEAYLLRRTRLTLRGWVGSLLAQARLRPPYGVVGLCRAAPKAVRQDLLAAVCQR